jgi:hypothetical protein
VCIRVCVGTKEINQFSHADHHSAACGRNQREGVRAS